MTLREAWRRGQRGWPARYPVAQIPNGPLLLALSSRTVAAVGTGTIREHANAVFLVSFSAWAWLEFTAGVNGYRRTVGAGALLFAVARVRHAEAVRSHQGGMGGDPLTSTRDGPVAGSRRAAGGRVATEG
jgi:hypothetical protein